MGKAIFDFTDEVVLVTGGSRGIGKAISIAFAKAGAKVIIVYRNNSTKANETLKMLEGKGHSLYQLDMTQDITDLQKMVLDLKQYYQIIDILVNNAGVYLKHAIPEIDIHEWDSVWRKTITTNLMGPANLSFSVAKEMIEQKSGKIINITSRGAFRGEPEYPAYGASKSGMNSFTQSIAQILAPHNIFVAAVAPGFVKTDMANDLLNGAKGQSILNQSPLGRAAEPSEIAQAVMYLCSEGCHYMTGAILDVNGASYLRN